MEEAFALAERGHGSTHPNPLVGAVLVRDGEVVGRGWHLAPGEPHAEAIALAEAGERCPGRHALLHPRAVQPPGQDAALRRRAGGGRRRPGGHRARRSQPPGQRPRTAQAARRRRDRRDGGGDVGGARPRAERAVHQVPPHRPAAGHVQGRDHPRRQGGRGRRRRALDQLPRQPAGRARAALARRRRDGRRRHRASRRPRAHRAPGRRPRPGARRDHARRRPAARRQGPRDGAARAHHRRRRPGHGRHAQAPRGARRRTGRGGRAAA